MERQTNNNRIGAYVMFCEEDTIWLDDFLVNAEMIDVDIAWQLDHCSDKTKQKIKDFKNTVWIKEETEPYLESFRQNPFYALKELGYKWAFHWDIDERWDISANLQQDFKDAEEKGAKVIQFPMFTAWGNKLRVDSIFNPKKSHSQTLRERAYYTQEDWRWRDKIIVSPFHFIKGKVDKAYKRHYGKSVIVHYGYSTEELREHHKKRWNDNYTRAVGKQPYDFWDYITNPEIEVELADYKQFNLTKK